MAELEDAYAAWRSRPFPPGSSDELLDELHADLALADTWVAEAVIPRVEHGLHQPARADVIDELEELRDRAVELTETSGRFADGDLADDYREYVDVLLRVYKVATA